MLYLISYNGLAATIQFFLPHFHSCLLRAREKNDRKWQKEDTRSLNYLLCFRFIFSRRALTLYRYISSYFFSLCKRVLCAVSALSFLPHSPLSVLRIAPGATQSVAVAAAIEVLS